MPSVDMASSVDMGVALTLTAPILQLANLVRDVVAAPIVLTATGTALITWSVSAGTLPPGMTLAADGTYSGTPPPSGSYTFGVTATNSAGIWLAA